MARWVIADGDGKTWLEVGEHTRARLVSDAEFEESKRTGLPPLGHETYLLDVVLNDWRRIAKRIPNGR